MEYRDPGRPGNHSILRIGAAVFLLAATCCLGGCIATQLKATSNRPVEANMEVFARASVLQHTMDSACLFRFSAPPEMAAASPMLTSVFQTRLEQRGPFAQIRLVPATIDSDAVAVWYARKMDCPLAIVPSLLYLIQGAGGTPTKLVVRIRILDAATGQVLWDIKQTAWSEPGPDIDLTWNTIVGAPARGDHALAECLADRFTGYLAQSLAQERKLQESLQQ
ncbi:MAG: hypothetical protein ACP5SH_08165 [Syntrophobacteraceae bacterium]